MDLLYNETWNHNNVDLVGFEDNMLLIFTWYFIVLYTITSLTLDQHPKHSYKWPNFRFYFNYSNRQPIVRGWCQFVEISILKFNLFSPEQLRLVFSPTVLLCSTAACALHNRPKHSRSFSLFTLCKSVIAAQWRLLKIKLKASCTQPKAHELHLPSLTF